MNLLSSAFKKICQPGILRTAVILALVTLVFRNTPFFTSVFKPFKTFDFFLHELSHATACLVTGGTVQWMKLVEGGVTDCKGGNALLIGQAGYLGQALLGAGLILGARFKHASNLLLFFMGVVIGLVNLFFLKDQESVTWALFLGAGLVWAGLRTPENWAHFLVIFIAVQTALYVFGDVELVVEHSLNFIPEVPESDATHMARLTGVPAYVWSTAWCFTALAMISLALYFSTKSKIS